MNKQLKEELLKAALTAEDNGLCRHRSGNFSAINEERTELVITPSGMDRAKMTLDDLVVMDLNGNILENKNDLKPSTEWRLHVAAYEARPDFKAVAHTHSPFVKIFAAMGKNIEPLTFESYFYGWKTALTERVFIPGSKELAESIRKPLKEASAIILMNHGALLGAESADQSVELACYLEEAAEVYYYSLLLKGENPEAVLSEETFVAYRRQNEGL